MGSFKLNKFKYSLENIKERTKIEISFKLQKIKFVTVK